MTLKQKILKLLGNGTPMLSMEMAEILNISKASASMATKELHETQFIHIAEWRHNAKNGGNKVYAIGPGEDAIKPEARWEPRNRYVAPTKGPFTPHADVAAAWMMTK